MHILYGGVSLIMNILVPNINRRGQKDLSSEVRHKAYARPLALIIKQNDTNDNKVRH